MFDFICMHVMVLHVILVIVQPDLSTSEGWS